jgi:hypothetical protein
MGNGIEPPYKDFFNILTKKYPTRTQGDGFIGLEITYDLIIKKENILDYCYLIIDGHKIIMNDFIKQKLNQ